ncbi:MAG TPA: hypothetical protein VKI17_01400, partial [Gemmataceae bacterium]|nr:hypothetical protein [Gemmataceae bacterium]
MTRPIGLAENPSATWPSWLDAFTKAFELDEQRLRRIIQQARSDENADLVPQLLAYWTEAGNFEGVLVASKTPATADISHALRPDVPSDDRQLEALLLACAPQGIIPIYGMYPLERAECAACHWLQPQSGFLVRS